MNFKSIIFGLVVIVILVAGLYRAKDGARESSVDIVRLETEIAEAYRQKELLEAELAHMSRREWIEDYARNELGMALARANQFATEYNLDLLVGPPQTVEEIAAAANRNETPDQTSRVPVPVTDASNLDPEEDAEQE